MAVFQFKSEYLRYAFVAVGGESSGRGSERRTATVWICMSHKSILTEFSLVGRTSYRTYAGSIPAIPFSYGGYGDG